jgi:hypothetical protein
LRQPSPPQRYHFGKKLFSRIPVQHKGVIYEEEVGGIVRLYLGNHLLFPPLTPAFILHLIRYNKRREHNKQLMLQIAAGK